MDIYWELLGTLPGFPPKKTLSWNRGKFKEIPKNSDWTVCSFTSRFLFSFVQQQCQRRARPKQADCKCTTSNNTNAWRRCLHFTSQRNKIKWQGVCTVKKWKVPKKRKKERTKETNYIYLLAHIMLRALLFKNNLIFDVGRWKDCREIWGASFRGKPTVHVLNIVSTTCV